MVNYWLAKQEPSGPRGYNFEQLKKEKTTVWDGVHNNLALKHMREMKSGEGVTTCTFISRIFARSAERFSAFDLCRFEAFFF